MKPFGTRLTLIAALTVIAGAASAADETRTVPAFDHVAFGGSGIIDVTVGQKQSLSLTGDAELLRHITTTVEDGKLSIGTENGYRWNGDKLAVHIALPRLTGLNSSGSAVATITGFNGGDTALHISGSGDITATGTLDKLDVQLSGSGKAHLDKLSVQAATVAVSGSGDIVVQPKRTLVSSISGSGEVRYIGSPQITSHVSGSGTIRPQ